MPRGTRLRHMTGPNLRELETRLENLPQKVEIKAVNRSPNGTWFLHFTILDNVSIQSLDGVPENENTLKPKRGRARKIKEQ